VLPFANIGGDPEQEHFVDGVTESLTTDLSRIRCAYVVARNTAFTYKERTGTRSYGANASIAAASYSQRAGELGGCSPTKLVSGGGFPADREKNRDSRRKMGFRPRLCLRFGIQNNGLPENSLRNKTGN
jgi:hypothetical protein